MKKSKKDNKTKGKSWIYSLLFWLLLISATFYAATFVKFNHFKPYLEDYITKTIERPFKINGDIGISFAGAYPAIALNDIVLDNREIGSYNVFFNPFAKGISIPKFTGNKGDAELEGDVEYINNNLILNTYIKRLPYTELMQGVEGVFDLKINLNGSGEDFEKIKNNLNGDIIFIGREGQLRSSVLRLWGGDLLMNIVSGFTGRSDRVRLNCAIADIAVENSIANIKTSVIDTRELVIEIKGSVNIVKEQMNLSLIPKPKNPSLVNFATQVNVKGGFANPVISADNMGMAKKMGKIALGVVNPATLAMPFIADTVMGDRSTNICAQYLE